MKQTVIFLLLSAAAIVASAQTPAFRGAEGGGMYASGGRGGVAYFVTTLSDGNSGNPATREGSLRWCIGQKGARTIIFKVSGTIFLNSELKIQNGDLTIAGQTAPGEGVCIAQYPVVIAADNVIIRFLRFRMGDEKASGDGEDALGGRFFRNVIIDHCSASWSTDECVSFYNCDNFTLQWCIISESLRLSSHSKGAHGYGGIWGGTNASFHHNLLAHHDSRCPRFGPGQNIQPHTETVDHRNNVIYNHGNTYGGEAMNINIVNNFYKPGPATSTGASRGRIISFDKDKTEGSIRYDVWGQLFVDGNVVDDGKNEKNCNNATADNWTYGVYNQFHSSYGTVSAADKAAMRMTEPFKIYGWHDGKQVDCNVTTHDARIAYGKVLDFAGASLRRDACDRRIIDETRTGTAVYKGASTTKPGIIDSQTDTKPSGAAADWSPWPALAGGETPAYNADGIPAGWLESKYPGKTALDINEEGFTYLEVYLNSIVEDIVNQQNKDAATGTEPVIGEPSEAATLRTYFSGGKLHVDSDNVIDKVSVFNMAGVLAFSLRCKGNNTSISADNLPAGLYLVEAEMNDARKQTVKTFIYRNK